jgi:uncharacterized protein (DUF305 family)
LDSAPAGKVRGSPVSPLEKLFGAAFDTAFLPMMVGHRQGAITMAKKGGYGPAKGLAKSITTSQSPEITQMNQMLGE